MPTRLRARRLPLAALALLLGGCAPGGEQPAEPSPTGEEDFPRTIEVPAGEQLDSQTVTVGEEPRRVAALTYETAEVLASLGAADRLVMAPEAMTNPALSNHAEQMGDIDTLAPAESGIDPETVISTEPDLVLLSDRHGLEEGVGDVLQEADVPVLVLPNTWASVQDMTLNIDLVGQALGLEGKADDLIADIDGGLGEEPTQVAADAPDVLVLSNQAGRPFITAGDAFPLELVRRAGGRDLSDELGFSRTGPISAEQLIDADPDAILLIDMNGSGHDIFTPLLDNPAVAALPALEQDRVMLLEGREVQALGLTETIEGLNHLGEWLDS